MKILVLVIVSFDKPVYYDMLQLWKQRHLQNVWFIQCKPASEWIGDIVNDVPESEPTLRDNFELDRAHTTTHQEGVV